MAVIRILLLPFSIIYGLITYVRNKLYDWKIFSSRSFDIPIVCLGNLSAGGTGKTPHVELLIRMLANDYNIATLSRGYKRKSKGFLLADANSSSESIGDEPFQIKTKFKQITVAVDEKRVRGVDNLLERIKDLELVILDDAFQHRSINPGLSILLTDYNNLYSSDFLLPSGTLREFRKGAGRADIIIVTKSPEVVSSQAKNKIAGALKPATHQTLYFSHIEYGNYSQIRGMDFIPDRNEKYDAILLVAGIANPVPLEKYLSHKCTHLEKLYFPDHHDFTAGDMVQMVRKYEGLPSKNKVIVTTEKDMMRLTQPDIFIHIKHLPLCYIPIQVEMDQAGKSAFENQIMNYVKNN